MSKKATMFVAGKGLEIMEPEILSGVLTRVDKAGEDAYMVQLRTSAKTFENVAIVDTLPLARGDRIAGVFAVKGKTLTNVAPIAASPGEDREAVVWALSEGLGVRVPQSRIHELYTVLSGWCLLNEKGPSDVLSRLCVYPQQGKEEEWPIPKKKVGKLLYWWNNNRRLRKLLLLGIEWNIAKALSSGRDVDKLFQKAKSTPYRIPTIPIDVADAIYQRFLRPPDLTERKIGQMARFIVSNVSDGVGIPIEKLQGCEDLKRIDPVMLRDFGIVVEPFMVFPIERYRVEKYVATTLQKLLLRVAYVEDDASLRSLIETEASNLSFEQKEAVIGCLTHSVSMLTGAAGTGKTTVISSIVGISRALGMKPLVCSFTGKAVMRLHQDGLGESRTIHRILYDENFAGYDLIIIDEASMVSLELLSQLFSHLHRKIEDFALVMVGDPFQLPPIDYGDPFNKMTLSISPIPRFCLTQVRRTEGEGILRNAIRLREARLNVPFVFERSPEFEILHTSEMQVVVNLYLEKCKAHGMHRVLLITPMNKERIDLNRRLRDLINPPSGKELERGGDLSLRVGDFVMGTKNSSTLKIWNGSEGFIREIHRDYIMFELGRNPHGKGEMHKIPTERLDTFNVVDLIHAYAITVHKAQGSEAEVVIFYCPTASYFTNRNLVYTALTRAKHQFFMVGNVSAVQEAVQRTYAVRNDRLLERIEEQCVE